MSFFTLAIMTIMTNMTILTILTNMTILTMAALSARLQPAMKILVTRSFMSGTIISLNFTWISSSSSSFDEYHHHYMIDTININAKYPKRTETNTITIWLIHFWNGGTEYLCSDLHRVLAGSNTCLKKKDHWWCNACWWGETGCQVTSRPTLKRGTSL